MKTYETEKNEKNERNERKDTRDIGVMDRAELNSVLYGLSKLSPLYAKFVQWAPPIFSSSVRYAAIGKDGDRKFLIFLNRKFWDSLPGTIKVWVLYHEIMHVFLDTFGREKSLKLEDKERSNHAHDIVINELSKGYLSINPDHFPVLNKFMWVRTVFSEKEIEAHKITTDGSLPYYYRLLTHLDKSPGNLICLSSGNDLSDEDKAIIREKVKEILRNLSDEELKDLKEQPASGPLADQAGEALGKRIERRKTEMKRRWKSVFASEGSTELEYDVRSERKIGVGRKNSMYRGSWIWDLPHESRFVGLHPKLTDRSVYMYIDTSGSCEHLSQQFYDIYQAVAEDHDVKVFGFHTKVYEIADAEHFKHGGTCFRAVANHYENLPRNEGGKRKVYVITDGHAEAVHLKNPAEWTWILTEDGSSSAIPNGCRIERQSFDHGTDS